MGKITEYNYYGNTISISDGFIKSRNGNNLPNKTMSGWKLQVECKDGSIFWVPLKYLKASNWIELSEYAINNNIKYGPAFRLWVKDAEKKLDRIIGKVAKKYWKTSHKFRVRFPKTVDETL